MTSLNFEWHYIPLVFFPQGFTVKRRYVGGIPQYRVTGAHPWTTRIYTSVSEARIDAERFVRDRDRELSRRRPNEESQADDDPTSEIHDVGTEPHVGIAIFSGAPVEFGFLDEDGRYIFCVDLGEALDFARKLEQYNHLKSYFEQHSDQIHEITDNGDGIVYWFSGERPYQLIQNGAISEKRYSSLDVIVLDVENIPTRDGGP